MIRTIFSLLPFVVCLGWLTLFAINIRKSDAAKRMLTLFLGVCSVLYFCHGLFFVNGPSHIPDCIWTLCSLLSYPLYLGYILRLTTGKLSWKYWLTVLGIPVIISLAKLIHPCAAIDTIQKIVFMIQVIVVLTIGFRRLNSFNARLKEFYSNTENRDTTPIKYLLIFFVVTSCLSSLANFLGRQFFGDSIALLIIISVSFSTLLFALSWIGFRRDFSIEKFTNDIEEITEPKNIPIEHHDDNAIGEKIERLLIEERIYLEENLTINDVVKRVDSCRTYVSNYINQEKGMSFSDYINRLRVDHAKRLMIEKPGQKQMATAMKSGYSNEQSFYRNFRKFTGMTPAEWLKQQTNKQISDN